MFGVEDIEQSLAILLATRRGERVMQDEFGCDLSEFLFGEISQGLIGRVRSVVADAILHHEPRITLNEIDVSRERSRGRAAAHQDRLHRAGDQLALQHGLPVLPAGGDRVGAAERTWRTSSSSTAIRSSSCRPSRRDRRRPARQARGKRTGDDRRQEDLRGRRRIEGVGAGLHVHDAAVFDSRHRDAEDLGARRRIRRPPRRRRAARRCCSRAATSPRSSKSRARRSSRRPGRDRPIPDATAAVQRQRDVRHDQHQVRRAPRRPESDHNGERPASRTHRRRVTAPVSRAGSARAGSGVRPDRRAHDAGSARLRQGVLPRAQVLRSRRSGQRHEAIGAASSGLRSIWTTRGRLRRASPERFPAEKAAPYARPHFALLLAVAAAVRPRSRAAQRHHAPAPGVLLPRRPADDRASRRCRTTCTSLVDLDSQHRHRAAAGADRRWLRAGTVSAATSCTSRTQELIASRVAGGRDQFAARRRSGSPASGRRASQYLTSAAPATTPSSRC